MIRTERERLEDILAAVAIIKRLATEPGDVDETARDAIYFNFVVVGEAARHLDAGSRDLAPEIPWGRIVSLRNFLAHDYHRIDQATIETIIRTELDPLECAVRRLLGE